jgi:hypothetical protein
MWIVEQHDPAGQWFTRATLLDHQDAGDSLVRS